MIHRSFKPAKCKTELKLAISRIKLLKNKRVAQLKQLKREVSQLLESGQIQNAKIRVEHVVKEERTMAAYDLIEVYCELIAARMSVIESQKNCPIDLKEPICCVIFASPRCAEIPELRKVSKQLTRKYGKEFLSAAVELRPDCGVNRLLVDKLSAKGPDSQTKLKALNAIAEELNIKWDPRQFEDYKKEKPNIRLSLQKEVKMDPAEILHNYDVRWSFGSQNVIATGDGVSKMVPSESGLSGAQSGSMEFKDAASAAQAAAESAELATIAARAAADLSSLGKNTGQGSSKSGTGPGPHTKDKGTPHGGGSDNQSEAPILASGHDDPKRSDSTMKQEESMRNDEASFVEESEKLIKDGPADYRSSNMQDRSASLESSIYATHADHLKSSNCDIKDQDLTKDPINGTLQSESLGIQGDQYDMDEQHKPAERAGDGQKSSDTTDHSVSIKSVLVSTSVFSPRNMEQAGRFPPDCTAESSLPYPLDEKERNSAKFKEEFNIEGKKGLSYENSDAIEDMQSGEQSSHSLNSHLMGPSIGNLNYDFESSGEKKLVDTPAEDPFTHFDDGNFKGDSMPENNPAPVVFDDYYSDGDGDIFDLDKGPETSLFNSSPGRESPTHLSAHGDGCSPRFVGDNSPGKNTSHSPYVVHENLANSIGISQSDKALAASSGELRGDSESEDVFMFNEENRSSCELPQDVSHAKFPGIAKKQAPNFSNVTDDSSDDGAEDHIRAQPPDSSSVVEAENMSFTAVKPYTSYDTESSEDCSSDGHMELQLDKLTGGIKHKHNWKSPYKKSSTREASLPAQANEDPSEKITQPASSIPDRYYQKVSAEVKKDQSSLPRNIANVSKKGNGSQPLQQEGLRGDLDSYYKKSRPQVNKKSTALSATTFFYSSDSESDSNAVPRVFTRKVHAPTKLSWRARDVSSESRPGLKSKLVSEESSAPLHNPKSVRTSSTTILESPVQEQPPNVHRTTAASVKTESLVSAQNPSRESSIRKASHVHPKLPDYDDLAARLQSLRTNKL